MVLTGSTWIRTVCPAGLETAVGVYTAPFTCAAEGGEDVNETV
jgi:hypothetical protein